jgi:hypothetical protein
MTELTTKIGAFNAAKRTVPVKFTSGDIVHDRTVNAVLNADGKYDAKATKARVAEVARGVAAKIDLGVIVAPIEEEAPAEGE